MTLLIKELRQAYQDFQGSKTPNVAIFSDNTNLYVLNGKQYESCTNQELDAVFILIVLEQIYEQTGLVLKDRMVIYKEFNKQYKNFLMENGREYLKLSQMVEFVLSITNDQSCSQLDSILISSDITKKITSFVIQREVEFVDLNDWDLERNEIKEEFEAKTVLKQCQIYDFSNEQFEYASANVNSEQLLNEAEMQENFNKLNGEIQSYYVSEIKPQILPLQKKAYVNSRSILVTPMRKFIDPKVFNYMQHAEAVQPVVRLSKMKHVKYFCLIPTIEDQLINERNLFNYILNNQYIELKNISVFSDIWSEFEGKVFDFLECSKKKNRILYNNKAEIIFISDLAQLNAENQTMGKGLRKFLLEEGRLLALFVGENDNIQKQLGEIQQEEIVRLIGEYKLNCFQFARGDKDHIEGSNAFDVNSEQFVKDKIWNLLRKRIDG